MCVPISVALASLIPVAVATIIAALSGGIPVSEALDPLTAAVSAAPTAAAPGCTGAGVPPPAAAGTQSSRKAPVAAPHGGKKKEQGRLAGLADGLKAWQVAFVLEIAEGGVLNAWSRTLEDCVKALEGERIYGGAWVDFAAAPFYWFSVSVGRFWFFLVKSFGILAWCLEVEG